MGRSVPGVDGEWQAALRQRGYRLTPQRQLVLEAVARLGHATPEEIVTAVRGTAGAVTLSTVYRTLELLEQLGLVQHAHLAHGSATWSVPSDDDHVHLVCRDCAQVQEVPREAVAGIAEELQARRGFVVDLGHLTVFGRCRACTASASASASEVVAAP